MDKDNRMTGRVTIPTDVDVVEDTLRLMERWGADALRDPKNTSLRANGLSVPCRPPSPARDAPPPWRGRG